MSRVNPCSIYELLELARNLEISIGLLCSRIKNMQVRLIFKTSGLYKMQMSKQSPIAAGMNSYFYAHEVFRPARSGLKR